MSKKKTYTLTLSEEQARIAIQALDLYSRIGIGQFEEIFSVYDQTGDFSNSSVARSIMTDLKACVGHPMNGSHGICNDKVRDEFRAAYDIQQVLRNRMALDRNPKGGITVDFDTPRATSKLPLPTVKSE